MADPPAEQDQQQQKQPAERPPAPAPAPTPAAAVAVVVGGDKTGTAENTNPSTVQPPTPPPPPATPFTLRQPPPGRPAAPITSKSLVSSDPAPPVPAQVDAQDVKSTTDPVALPAAGGAGASADVDMPGPSITSSSSIQQQPQPQPQSQQKQQQRNGDGAGGIRVKAGRDRERGLFMLVGDSAPSLAQVRTKGGGEKKEGRVGNWKWLSFAPSNRPSGSASSLRLGHWRKLDHESSIQKHHDEFAVFGKEDGQALVVGYTQSEYEKWLHDDKWTPDETSYLFSLLAEYDLRFLIVADRYAYLPKSARTGVPEAAASSSSLSRKKSTAAAAIAGSGMRRSARGTMFGGAVGEEDYDSRDGTPAEGEAGAFPLGEVKRRSIEEIKDRYYTICRRLIRNRPAKDEQARERALKAYEYDMRKEIQRKRNADALFHLTRPQIIEEEALYMELKKMEQTERRYRGEREELMRRVNGLESGVLWPSASVAAGGGGSGSGMEGNRVFGNGVAVGIGAQRARDGTVVGVDKLKKRKRGDEIDVGQAQEMDVPEVLPAAPEDDPEFDRRNNIYRLPSSGAASSSSSSTRTLYQPAFLRSTKLAQPRSTSSAQSTSRITELLEQHGVSPSRLLMPTRHNLEAYEALLGTCAMLVDVKRMVDRAEQEVRVLRMQKDTGYGGLGMGLGMGLGTGSGTGSGSGSGMVVLAPAGSMPPPPVPMSSEQAAADTSLAHNSARSASVVSSASEAVSRRRK